MANNEDERILSIKVKYGDAIAGILQYQKKVDELKEAQKALKEEVKAGTLEELEYRAALAQNKAEMKEAQDSIRALEKETRNNLKTQQEKEGALKSLRAELSNATKEYDELSRAEREGAKGKDLELKINRITDELKEAEEKTQRFYRNVGNYEDSVSKALDGLKKNVTEANDKYQELVKTQGEHAEVTKKAKKNLDDAQLSLKFAKDESDNLNSSVLGFVTAGNPWAMTAINMVKQLGSVRNGFVLVKTGAQLLGKQLLALLANPIVAFLAGLATVVSLLVKGISSSEESMNRWKVAMAPVSRALEGLTSLLQTACGWILSVVETGGKLLGWLSALGEKIPFIGGLIKKGNDIQREAIELAKEEAQLSQQARKDQVENAKDQLEVAKLRQQAKDKEKFTAQDRLKFVQKANKLEEQQSKRNMERATREYELLKKRSEWAENDRDTNDKLAELEAAKYNAEKEYFQKTMELLEQENTIKSEITAKDKERLDAEKKAVEDRKKAAEEAVTIRKERAQKETEAIRQAEDAMLSLIKDGIEKQRRQITLSYDREIEDLKKKLAEEKNLTQKAKDAINQTIKTKEQEKVNELQKLSDEEVQKSIEKEEKRIALLLQTVKKGSEAEYQLKIQQLMKQEEAELAAADSEIASAEEREATKLAIRQKYNLLNDELMESHNNSVTKKQQDALKLEFETKIAAAGNDEVQVLQLKMEQKRVELESMQQLEGESIQAFNLRKLQVQNEYNNSKQSLTDKEVEIEQTKYQAVESIVGGLGSLTETLGEKNTTFAKLSKVLALGELAVNTGKAIAAGVAQAQSLPFPGNMAAIATTIATVLANIATATKTVKSAKFAQGGSVVGPGSGTSDSIPAMLSDGESVLTAAATSMFSPMLSAFNQMGGGIPINVTATTNQALGEDMLAKAVAKGMGMAPPPVLSVEEYTTVSNRVKYLENLGSV